MGYLISTQATSGPGKLSSTMRILKTSMPYTYNSLEVVCKLPITDKYCEDKGGLGLEFKSQHIHEPEPQVSRSCFFSVPILPWSYDKLSSFIARLITTRSFHICLTRHQQSSYDLTWFSQHRSWHMVCRFYNSSFHGRSLESKMPF